MRFFTKFFTALAVCALMLSACNKEEVVEFTIDDAGLTRGGNGKIGFKKVVQISESETRPAEEGEFTFEMYAQKQNGKGAPTLVRTLTTDANGEVWVDFNSLNGNSRILTFREVFASEEEDALWEPLADLVCDVVPSEGAIWDGVSFGWNEGPEVVNIPVVPEEEPVDGYANTKAVTLTNDANNLLFVNKKNGNGTHNNFTYAVLSREALEAGPIKLDMITNGNHQDVGDAFVKLENGKLVLWVEAGELNTKVFEIYNDVWSDNGNDNPGLMIDAPAGDEDFRIYVNGNYSWN